MEDWEGKLKKTGSLLLLDAPKHLQFGIDNQEWTVGDKFKGITIYYIYIPHTFRLKANSTWNAFCAFFHVHVWMHSP